VKLSILWFTLVASIGFVSVAAAQTVDGTSRPVGNQAAKPALQRFSVNLTQDLRNVPVPSIQLPPMDATALVAEDQARETSGDKSMRVGVERELRVQLKDGRWDPMPEGGWLWRAEVVSKGAAAMRVHFTLMNLPVGGQIVFYASADPEHIFGPLTGRGPSDGDLWARPVLGDRITIEYFAPGETQPDGNPFQIDRVIHDYRDPLTGNAVGIGGDKEGTCHNDVMCFPPWISLSYAVGRIDYVQGGNFQCTGELLNNTGGDFTPYFLTANHCINTVGGANSAIIYWDYQTPSCGGAVPALNTVPTSSYCTLLSNNATSDYCLLMVEGALPGGLVWSGWDANPQPDGLAEACIHHPTGAYKRISFGNKASNTTCASNANHIRSNWTSGVTEPGSSGSGLYRGDNQRLIGQLHCGPSVCGGTELHDDYGAFNITYPNIAGFLNGGTDDGFEPNDACASATPLGNGTWNNLIVRYGHEDWYSVSVPANKRITVTINFTHAWGDIDMNMYDACGGSIVAGSAGVSDQEQIDYENLGGATTYKIHVYLFSDTRNQYNMTINVADLPNLNATVTPGGFSSPAVPRDLNDSGLNNAVLTPTLEGNTNNTYLNWAIQNEGPGNTPQGWESRLYFDEDLSGSYGVFGIGPNNPGFFSWQALNVGPVTIAGGRHSLDSYADYNNTVPESNEGDNVWRGQWVWSPLIVNNFTPVQRPHSPLYGYFAQPNCDGFQFTRGGANAWVVGIAGTNASDDCDLTVYSDYVGSSSGFSALLGSSAYGGDLTDFVVGHFSGTPTTVYPGAHHFAGAGDILVDQSYSLNRFTSAQNYAYYNQVLDANRLVDVYEGFFNSGVTYYFQLVRSTGTSDIAFNIYNGSVGGIYGRVGAVAFSTPMTPGDDVASYTPTVTGWHPIVVYRNEGQNANNAVTYTLIWRTQPIVGVDDPPLPLTLEFAGARPNPMPGSGELEFDMPRSGYVKLQLYDLDGRRVKTIVDGEVGAGHHAEIWDGRTDSGARVGAGIYWARFQAAGTTITRRLTLLH